VTRVLSILFLAIAVVIVACDPGMTIRQFREDLPTNSSSVIVHVATIRPLIGETWYAAGVGVTNPLDTPIEVTNVELAARGKTYTNKPAGSETYPLVIPPRNTVTLGVRFTLDEDVWKTFFQQTAELRVYYRRGSHDEIARASIIGGRLNDGP
jgi:hypothetical protein